MKQNVINSYSFNELSEAAKNKAIQQHYENEDYYFLSEDLNEYLIELLNEYGYQYLNIKLEYSLSNSQGDGVNFTGELKINCNNEITIKIEKLNFRYCHELTTALFFYDENNEQINEIDEIKKDYIQICKKVEKYGYSILEYRMSFDEFNEYSEENNIEYFISGKLFNL